MSVDNPPVGATHVDSEGDYFKKNGSGLYKMLNAYGDEWDREFAKNQVELFGIMPIQRDNKPDGLYKDQHEPWNPALHGNATNNAIRKMMGDL